MRDKTTKEVLRKIGPDENPALDKAIEDSASKLRENTRQKIALYITYTYSIIVGLIAAYLAYKGIICEESVADSLFELLKVGVVPIVTLVMGFYFGSSKA